MKSSVFCNIIPYSPVKVNPAFWWNTSPLSSGLMRYRSEKPALGRHKAEPLVTFFIYCSTLKTDAVRSSKTLVNIHHTTRGTPQKTVHLIVTAVRISTAAYWYLANFLK
jgi:hypothetical protein